SSRPACGSPSGCSRRRLPGTRRTAGSHAATCRGCPRRGSTTRGRSVSADTILVGAARLPLAPPLDLPLVGFVRQTHDATGYGRYPLETTAIALERDGLRVVLCGVDIVGIGEPEVSALLARIADATGADPAGI